MAQISFEQLQTMGNNNNYDESSQVGFFNLQNDGQEAVVRFICDSTKDFEILTVHDISLNGKIRQANCVRDARSDVSNCPLCATGHKLSNKVYIKLIQYNRDPSGAVTAKPMVWSRGANWATKLKGYLDNYGPLSDIICKIVRHGAKGSLQTEYEVIPNLNKQIYRDDIYVKDTSAFDNWQALGRIVFNKTFDELAEFVSTGKFPQTQKDVNAEAVAKEPVAPHPVQQPVYSAPSAPQFESLTDEDLPWNTENIPTAKELDEKYGQPTVPPVNTGYVPQQNPWANQQTGGSQTSAPPARPVRRY